MAKTSTQRNQSHTFSQVPAAEIQRSVFDRSHGHKTTHDVGWLIPMFVDEALPGDTFSMKATFFSRIATLLFPIMDNVYLDCHFFAVPNRLLWDNWEKFLGAQDNPGDSTDFLVPEMTTVNVGGATLHDYLGIPILAGTMTHSALFHRAYARVWNDWYRDENLQDSIVSNTDDGPDDPADYVLMKRGKRHDYFTSALPFAQKGPAVELPLGLSADVTLNTPNVFPGVGVTTPTFLSSGGGGNIQLNSDGTVNTKWSGAVAAGTANWQNPGINVDVGGALGTADLSSATAATINELRQAIAIQRLYERDARGGTRINEVLKAHFGVSAPDFRLQRAEFLGGGSIPVMQTPVPATTQNASADLGQLGSYGVAAGSGIGFTKSFVEHSVILGIVSVRADLNYQQGLERQYSRSTRWDFYWPALSHIGEQAVLNKEIYVYDVLERDNVFGYQERYAEYRYKPSRISGQLRSDAVATLDAWHLAQDFSSLPVLGDSFIQENPPLGRAIAQPLEPDFITDSYFQLRCARPMPTYSVPGMMDHF